MLLFLVTQMNDLDMLYTIMNVLVDSFKHQISVSP